MRIFVLLRCARRGPRSSDVLPGLDPADRAALTAGLRLARPGLDEVLALTAGSRADEPALQAALLAGASRGIRVSDPSLLDGDLRALASLLAAAIRHLGFDLVLAGCRSSDWASGGTGPAVAHFLGVPHVTAACDLQHQERRLELMHRGDDAVFRLRLDLPSAVSVCSTPTGPLPTRSSDLPEVEVLDLTDMTLPFRFARGHGDPALEQVEQGGDAQPLTGARALLQLLRGRRLIR